MAERRPPNVFSIAAHRGFADALVAGLIPRYADKELGLARLTLLPGGKDGVGFAHLVGFVGVGRLAGSPGAHARRAITVK